MHLVRRLIPDYDSLGSNCIQNATLFHGEHLWPFNKHHRNIISVRADSVSIVSPRDYTSMTIISRTWRSVLYIKIVFKMYLVMVQRILWKFGLKINRTYTVEFSKNKKSSTSNSRLLLSGHGYSWDGTAMHS